MPNFDRQLQSYTNMKVLLISIVIVFITVQPGVLAQEQVEQNVIDNAQQVPSNVGQQSQQAESEQKPADVTIEIQADEQAQNPQAVQGEQVITNQEQQQQAEPIPGQFSKITFLNCSLMRN